MPEVEKTIIGEQVKKRIIWIAAKKNLSIRAFEIQCGVGSGTISKIGPQGPSSAVLWRIVSTFPDVSADYLISGKKPQQTTVIRPGIPLLPFSALAGYMGENNSVQSFTGETVYFPDFSERGADCAIRVEGDSMIPRYNNGDVLAIRILHDPTFFQWGRCYVVSTTQGCIVKRLFPDPSDPDAIICHSENSEMYPDYKITKSDVIAIAIVVGHAGLE